VRQGRLGRDSRTALFPMSVWEDQSYLWSRYCASTLQRRRDKDEEVERTGKLHHSQPGCVLMLARHKSVL
jgi:hypothetical protein